MWEGPPLAVCVAAYHPGGTPLKASSLSAANSSLISPSAPRPADGRAARPLTRGQLTNGRASPSLAAPDFFWARLTVPRACDKPSASTSRPSPTSRCIRLLFSPSPSPSASACDHFHQSACSIKPQCASTASHTIPSHLFRPPSRPPVGTACLSSKPLGAPPNVRRPSPRQVPAPTGIASDV